jgi:hypothetical protein
MSENPLGDLALHILDAINDTFASAGVDLPTSQFVTLGGQGATTHLGEQLTVSVEELYSGTPGDQAQEPVRCNAPQSASFAVELVRCAPTGAVRGRSTPLTTQEDTTQQTEVALARMQDMKLLMDAGMNAVAGTWSEMGIVTLSAAPPNGGVQALVMAITTVV